MELSSDGVLIKAAKSDRASWLGTKIWRVEGSTRDSTQVSGAWRPGIRAATRRGVRVFDICAIPVRSHESSSVPGMMREEAASVTEPLGETKGDSALASWA